jgi:hypothetical protein
MGESGGIAQAATQLMGEMQQAQNDARLRETHAGEEAAKAFHSVMEETKKIRDKEKIEIRKELDKGSKIIAEAQRGGFAPLVSIIGDAQRYEQSKLVQFFKKLVGGQDKMTEIMEETLSGKHFIASEVLQMQAAIFQYCQELEYSTHVVDKADTAVKQIVTTQVG